MTSLGPYTILSPVGAGGMGEVYRARDSRLDRDVAIKVLPKGFSNDPAALKRFRGRSADWRLTAAGGIVAHTADNYPVCDWVMDNAYAIVDSGHGFKTLAIGRLAAAEIASREPDRRLEPFRADRFRRGELLAASKGPYPWT